MSPSKRCSGLTQNAGDGLDGEPTKKMEKRPAAMTRDNRGASLTGGKGEVLAKGRTSTLPAPIGKRNKKGGLR